MCSVKWSNNFTDGFLLVYVSFATGIRQKAEKTVPNTKLTEQNGQKRWIKNKSKIFGRGDEIWPEPEAGTAADGWNAVLNDWSGPLPARGGNAMSNYFTRPGSPPYSLSHLQSQLSFLLTSSSLKKKEEKCAYFLFIF